MSRSYLQALTAHRARLTSKKTVHLKTDGSGSLRAALTSIWGPKSGEGLVEVDFEVELPPSAEGEASSSGT
jgi:hypothetical protein